MPTQVPVADQTILANLGWRYAVKKFDAARKIPQATWATIEEAIRLAPSSHGLQPWQFVVVTDPTVRAKLRAASWNQPQITDASHLVVFCRRIEVTAADVDAFVADVASQRGVTVESLKDYRNMMAGSVAKPETLPGGTMDTYTRSQTYIALGVFLTTCAMLGIDACPMEGFDPKGYDAILNTSKDGYIPVVLGAAGYRASDDWLANLRKVRASREKVFKHV
jgi:nitroreductase